MSARNGMITLSLFRIRRGNLLGAILIGCNRLSRNTRLQKLLKLIAIISVAR
jgi:hypothetical protein